MNDSVSRSQSGNVTVRTTRLPRVGMSLLALSLLLLGFPMAAQESASQPTAKEQESTEQGTESKQFSGFLGDYSKLHPDPKNSDLLIYWKEKDVLKHYSKFMVDPVTIFLLPKAQNREIDPEDLARLTKEFHDDIVEELTKAGYEVVSSPGPGVLEGRLAITNVEPTASKKNVAVKAGAMAASTAVAPGAALLVPRFSVGRASIEGELLDSASGERVAAFVTSRAGQKWFSGLKGYKQWGDVDAAFRTWAKNFANRVKQAHEESASN